MMTEEQDGQARAKNDAIFNIWGICQFHTPDDSDRPQGPVRWWS